MANATMKDKRSKDDKPKKPEADAGSYDASSITVLEGLEAVRKRPAMYIGDSGNRGLHHLVEEVVDNSIDEAMAGHAKKVEVLIHPDNSVTVIDDGRGIPVDQHKTEKKSALEVVLTKLHAGGKFDSKTYKVAGGLHGVGVSVVNALSEWLEAEVRRDGKIYRQRYQRGKPASGVTAVGKATGTGTKITFKADKEIFKSGIVYNYETVVNRLRELAFLNKGLSVTIKDERSGKESKFQFEGGIKEFVAHINKNKTPLHNPIYFEDEREHVSVEIALQYNESYSESLFSFANNINTIDGGTHLSGFKSALTRTINNYCKSKNLFKGDELKIESDDARAGLTAVVSVKVPQPQFEGQTKAKLGSPEVEGIVQSVCNEKLGAFFEEHPSVASKIADKCLVEARARERARHERDLTRRKGLLESSALPGKLADCSERDAALCEIYVVEGDSAGGCFSGDTKIALTDGRNLSFLELIAEAAQGKEHFCYTIRPGGYVGIERVLNPRKTKTATKAVEVQLDNGEGVVCTPDHLFMLRDGTFKQAVKLHPNDSLMPLYRQISRLGRRITIEGYEMVFVPAQERWVFTHVLADEYNIQCDAYQVGEASHRHHLDFNKRNNNPTNVRRLTKDQHLDEHRRHAAKTLKKPEVLEKLRILKQSPEYRERIRQAMLKPVMRETLSFRARQQWQNETYKRFMAKRFSEFYAGSPEYREQNRQQLNEAQKTYWSSIEHREKQAARVRKSYQDHPEAKQELSLIAKAQWSKLALRQWRSGKTAQQWTPEFRQQRRSAYNQTYLNHSLGLLAGVLRQGGGRIEYETSRRQKRNPNVLKYETLCQRFFAGDEFLLLDAAAHRNHRVVSVRPIAETIDVYDLEVPGTHNFALASGVFVHNSAKQGRDRRFQAILPIKGKILNVERARLEKILVNEEVRTIITALGCGVGNEFNIEKLRYHKILLMADADVDGNHIRTLLLTLFYRQMPKLIEGGHIYIAQPPLYKIKRGKREEYVETDADMVKMLLELGSEDQVLTHIKAKKTWKEKALIELMSQITELDQAVRGLARYRINPATYFSKRDAKKGLPLYFVRMDGQENFLYNDAELSKFAEKHELNLEELEKASVSAKAQFAELFESSELDDLSKKLEKQGIEIEDCYSESLDAKPVFKLSSEGKDQTYVSLREVLQAIQDNGRHGMTIQRYKGLGEMNPTQLWETTMDPEKRTILKVTSEDAVEADRMFTTLMGDAVEPRKQFIEEFALDVKELDI